MNKHLIQKRFNAASRTYDSVATIQNNCAERLTNLLTEKWPDFQPATILDLGTGTGYMPALLQTRFPNCQFTLNDMSPEMLAYAQEKLGSSAQIQCQLGDIESTNFAYHDLTVSNLALQWMNNLETTLNKFYLNSDRLAFTCLLKGTFQEWAQLNLMPSQSYPSCDQLEHFLLSLNPRDCSFATHDFRMTFQGAQSFMVYLKKIGASVSQTAAPLSHLKRLIQTHHEPFDVTYRVFFGILRRA